MEVGEEVDYIIIIIDNVCISLFSGVPKLTPIFTTRMASALRWAVMRAILMFH